MQQIVNNSSCNFQRMMAVTGRKIVLFITELLLGLLVFSWFIPHVRALPQGLLESYSDETTPAYDGMGMPVRPDDGKNPDEQEHDPFKPKDGHTPGGLPMISDSAFSLTILIYVSVAFLLVFFLFCWKTNGGNGTGNPEELKQQCPLMVNNDPDSKHLAEPCVIPPTPTSDTNRIK